MARDHKPGTLRGTVDEIRRGDFIANARLRSTRRKSPWNLLLLLIFPLWIFVWFKSLAILWNVALLIAGESVPHTVTGWLNNSGLGPRPMSWPGALYIFAPFLPTLASAMVLGNFLVYLIPPARRAMDNEDRAFPGTEYSTAQRTLGKLALGSLPPGILLSLLGAWLEVAR